MRKCRRYALALPLMILPIFVPSGISQGATEEDYPANLSEYEFLHYSRGQYVISPEEVVRADNNWEILLACLIPRTEKELKALGVSYTKSQALLLEAMRFIERDPDAGTAKTILPILGLYKKRKLERRMQELAVQVEPELREEVHALLEELKKVGREENAYSILFSFALDSIPWRRFLEKGVTEELRLSPSRPLYDGIYWAVYPRSDFRCGTNFEEGEDFYIAVNWSDGSLRKIWKAFNWTNLQRLRDDYAAHGRIVDKELRRELAAYEIFDSDGNFTIPIIDKTGQNALFSASMRIGEKAATLFMERQDLEKLKDELGLHDVYGTVIVAYHVWMWKYLEHLHEIGTLEKPVAFANPAEAEPAHIGQLLFLVKGKPEQ